MHAGNPGEPIGVAIPAYLGKIHEEAHCPSSMRAPIDTGTFNGAQQVLTCLALPHEIQQQRLHGLNH